MLIYIMTQMMVMFGAIIVVGLFLTWINDGLETLVRHFTPRGKREAVPPALPAPAHDYAGKIVRVELAPRSRSGQNNAGPTDDGEKLGEHVTVHLPKAA
jgi:hypothetical protein